MGVGEKGDGRNFVEGVRVFAIEDGKFLKTAEADRFVATLEIGMAGFADLGKDESTHDVARLEGGMYLGDSSHPNAHGGIDRERNLTRARAWPSWRTGRGDSQSCRGSGVIRPLGRDELAIGAWQGGKEGRKTVMAMADL
jgi:hypothetical protein